MQSIGLFCTLWLVLAKWMNGRMCEWMNHHRRHCKQTVLGFAWLWTQAIFLRHLQLFCSTESECDLCVLTFQMNLPEGKTTLLSVCFFCFTMKFLPFSLALSICHSLFLSLFCRLNLFPLSVCFDKIKCICIKMPWVCLTVLDGYTAWMCVHHARTHTHTFYLPWLHEAEKFKWVGRCSTLPWQLCTHLLLCRCCIK